MVKDALGMVLKPSKGSTHVGHPVVVIVPGVAIVSSTHSVGPSPSSDSELVPSPLRGHVFFC